MPLQDSFKRKTTSAPKPEPVKPARASVLTGFPTLEDLRFASEKAQANARQPIMITWRRDGRDPAFLLTVMRDVEYEPTWILHIDDVSKPVIVWSYQTVDVELIFNLLTEEVSQSAPAAVIPEHLRPGYDDSLSTPIPVAHPTMRSVPVEHDSAFSDTYQIVSTIGRGGMGVIYKAVHLATGHYVALKVLHPHLLIDPSSLERFKQEASAASALAHPNLISVREFGFSSQGHPFIAMDYLEGVELQTLLSHCNHLEMPAFINIFTQICEALEHAHNKGLVHRDLKPGNIMLIKGSGGQEVVKIIDFGIAKMLNEQAGGKRITTAGELLGSPAYMSPEQCGGAILDARSDIYSLGCVMYEAITGALPFPDSSVVKTIMMQINDTPAPFVEVRPDLEVPAELEALIFKAMAKDPDERYQSAEELREALWEFAASGVGPVSARMQASGSHPAPIMIEQNTMSSKTYTLLRRANILTSPIISTAAACERLIDEGSLNIEQAMSVIAAVKKGKKPKDALAEVGCESELACID